MTQQAPAVPVDDKPPAELDPLGRRAGNRALVPGEPATVASRKALAPRTAVSGPQATPESAFAFYESQLELAEYPPGSNANWLTDWYGMGHVAWCAITVSRALIAAGFGTPDQIDVPGVRATSAKGWAYCPYVEDDFAAAARWHDAGEVTPEPGDLVLYDWDGDAWPDHVGMLKALDDDGSLWVYEGNTDEGVLRLKHRSMTYVLGFARPPWTPATPPPPPQEADVSKIAYPLEVHAGETRKFPVPAIAEGFAWTKGAVTFASAGVEVLRAVVGPTERAIAGLAPDGVETSRLFDGRSYVDLQAGDEWIAVELGPSPEGHLDLMVEATDAPTTP